MPEVGYQKRKASWTPEEVLSKIHAWVEEYGEPPTATEWHPGDAMRAARRSADRAQQWASVAERFHEGEWPWVGTVQRLFGGWNNALSAAGVEVRWQRRRTTLGEEPGALDTDEMRSMVDQLEQAMVIGDAPRMQVLLCGLAARATAWASEIGA